ncbi:hypothetical protein EGW08_020876 [Elysia chlorotica]|uniref:Uncharacterized protein n=1 Tax=Elysia chlorotica TaxID=188477 RepID=A0A3S0Z5W8_ELYCH|nr:hypothetical protein EGW08_020876 [Elysia chlorotica]
MMKFRKERTEIVLHEDRSFITKLPAYVEVNEAIQTVFDAYRGKAYLSRDLPSRDERFRRLETMLQPPSRADLTTPATSTENFTCKSRKKLGLHADLDAAPGIPAVQPQGESRVMVASRGRSRDNDRGVDYMTDCRKSAANSSLRRAEILHSFKTQDLNELAKSLTRESHIDLSDVRQDHVTAGGQQRRPSNIPSACGRNRPKHHVPSLGLNSACGRNRPKHHVPSLGLKFELKEG